MNEGSIAASPADAPARVPVPACPPGRPAPLSSIQLLRGERLVEIAHNGEIYRLQATRQGKLILTK
jgi:hemin uptake protein HemP